MKEKTGLLDKSKRTIGIKSVSQIALDGLSRGKAPFGPTQSGVEQRESFKNILQKIINA